MIQVFEHDYCFAYFTVEWWTEGYYLLTVFDGNHQLYYQLPKEFANIDNARIEGEELLSLIHARYGRKGHQ